MYRYFDTYSPGSLRTRRVLLVEQESARCFARNLLMEASFSLFFFRLYIEVIK